MEETNEIDLSTMSTQELRELRAQVDSRIDAIVDEERKKLAAEFEKKAAELGMTPEEVIRGSKKARQRAPVKPKYRDPSDPSRTWTGRGKQPVWLREALAAGKNLEDFLIKV